MGIEDHNRDKPHQDILTTNIPTVWGPEEHSLHRFVKKYDLENKIWTVACSGGVDSVVLLSLLKNIASASGATVKALYIHHGKSENMEQGKFRDESLVFVREYSQSLSINFHWEKSEEFLKTEEEFRDFRLGVYRRHVSDENTYIFLGHHAEDQLETQIMRLLRGTSLKGLQAMRPLSHNLVPNVVRPLLECSKADLIKTAEKQSLKWMDDPSNSVSDYKRNWVRNELLGLIKKQDPVGLITMAKSLSVVSDELRLGGLEMSDFEVRLAQSDWLSFDENAKLMWLKSLVNMTKGSATLGQYREVIRHLDRLVPKAKLELIGFCWISGPEGIKAKVVKK